MKYLKYIVNIFFTKVSDMGAGENSCQLFKYLSTSDKKFRFASGTAMICP